MELNQLTTSSLNAAAQTLGEGRIHMVNLLWFRDFPSYPPDFDGALADVRKAYYEGYAGAFRNIVCALEIEIDLAFAGSRLAGLVAGSDDEWDDVAIVSYPSFEAFRAVVEHADYQRLALPHRIAAVRNWRLIATAAR